MLYVILAILILIADAVTKTWASAVLTEGSIPVIFNFFHLTYVENTGAAFGILADKRAVFITLSFLILAVLLVYYIRCGRRDRWLKLGTALIFSGSVGNLIERITKGYVVDFLDFRIISFPVFNVADIAVCIGAAALVIHFLFSDSAKENADGGR